MANGVTNGVGNLVGRRCGRKRRHDTGNIVGRTALGRGLWMWVDRRRGVSLMADALGPWSVGAADENGAGMPSTA